jgi:hypothetical protein
MKCRKRRPSEIAFDRWRQNIMSYNISDEMAKNNAVKDIPT